MSFVTGKFRKKPGFAGKRLRGKGKDKSVQIQALGIVALRRAVDQNLTSVIRIGSRRVAIVPLLDHPRLERLLEQEEKERELDRLDIEEAERILNDPTEVTIPYEQVRRELGLGDLPN